MTKSHIRQPLNNICHTKTRYTAAPYTKTDVPDTMETSKTTTLHKEQQNTVEKCVDNHVENRWKKMWI